MNKIEVLKVAKALISSLLFCFLSLMSSFTHAGTSIKICTDSNFWYPFTYVNETNKEAAGLHIDIISKALKDLGYDPNFKPMPWKQCLKDAKEGEFDAVATVSYRADRAEFLDYPADAANVSNQPEEKSKDRVTQVEYVVITPTVDAKGKPNVYSYQGDLKTIPMPVRIPMGYSILDNLEKAGLKVQEDKHSIDNFKKLVKDKSGSVIGLEDVAKHLSLQPEFHDKLRISDKPIFSKSYFLAFTKKGSVKDEEQKKIWAEIAKVRENSAQMGKFLEKY